MNTFDMIADAADRVTSDEEVTSDKAVGTDGGDDYYADMDRHDIAISNIKSATTAGATLNHMNDPNTLTRIANKALGEVLADPEFQSYDIRQLNDDRWCEKLSWVYAEKLARGIKTFNETHPKSDRISDSRTKDISESVVAEMIGHADDIYILSELGTREAGLTFKWYVRNKDGSLRWTGIWRKVRLGWKDKGLNAFIKNLTGNAKTPRNPDDMINSVMNVIRSRIDRDTNYVDGYSATGHFAALQNGIWDWDKMKFTEWEADDFEKDYGDLRFFDKTDTKYNPKFLDTSNIPAFETNNGTWTPADILTSLTDDEMAHRCMWEHIQFALRGIAAKQLLCVVDMTAGKSGHNTKSTFANAVSNIIYHINKPGKTDPHNGENATTLTSAISNWGDSKCELAQFIPNLRYLVSHEPTADPDANRKRGGDANCLKNADFIRRLINNEIIMYDIKYVNKYPARLQGPALSLSNGPLDLGDGPKATYSRLLIMTTEKVIPEDEADTRVRDEYVYDNSVSEWLVCMACHTPLTALLDEYSAEVKSYFKDNKLLMQVESSIEAAALSDIVPAFNGGEGFMLPSNFLYGLYKGWLDANGYDYHAASKKTFNKKLGDYCAWNDTYFSCHTSKPASRPFSGGQYWKFFNTGDSYYKALGKRIENDPVVGVSYNFSDIADMEAKAEMHPESTVYFPQPVIDKYGFDKHGNCLVSDYIELPDKNDPRLTGEALLRARNMSDKERWIYHSLHNNGEHEQKMILNLSGAWNNTTTAWVEIKKRMQPYSFSA